MGSAQRRQSDGCRRNVVTENLSNHARIDGRERRISNKGCQSSVAWSEDLYRVATDGQTSFLVGHHVVAKEIAKHTE